MSIRARIGLGLGIGLAVVLAFLRSWDTQSQRSPEPPLHSTTNEVPAAASGPQPGAAADTQERDDVAWDAGFGPLRPLTGRVVDDRHVPIAGARVCVISRPYIGSQFITESGTNGEFSVPFRIPRVTTSFLALRAEKDGYLPNSALMVRADVSGLDELPVGMHEEVEIVLAAIGLDGSIHGVVMAAESNAALVDAGVRVLLGGSAISSCRTDAEGRFSCRYLSEQAPKLRLAISYPGYLGAYVAVDHCIERGSGCVVVRLTPRADGALGASSLMVRVVSDTGKPVEGAAVYCDLIEREQTVGDAVQGSVDKSFVSNHLSDALLTKRTVGGGRRDIRTNGRGIAVHWPTIPGKWRVSACSEAQGIAESTIQVGAGSKSELELKLQPSGSMLIRVHGMNPEHEYKMAFDLNWLPSDHVTLPPNGEFRASNARAGRVSVSIFSRDRVDSADVHPSDSFLRVWRGLAGVIENPMINSEFRIQLGVTKTFIAGVVVDGDGRGVEGVTVHVADGVHAVSDADGKFTFTGLDFMPSLASVRPVPAGYSAKQVYAVRRSRTGKSSIRIVLRKQ